MKELALKYGCNPNQKPSRIYMDDDRESSDRSIKRPSGRISIFWMPSMAGSWYVS